MAIDTIHLGIVNADLSMISIGRALVFQECGIFPMYYHIWFIIPFLTVNLAAPLLFKACAGSVRSVFIYMISAAIVLMIFDASGIMDRLPIELNKQIRYFVNYSAFFVSGFLYKQDKATRWFALGVFLTAILTLLTTVGGYSINMQYNKFPPNLSFFIFGCLDLCICGFCFKYLKFKPNRILDRYNKAGYTIFLYQNFVLFFIALFITKFIGRDANQFLTAFAFAISLVLSIVLNYVLSFLTFPLEKKLMSIGHKKGASK